MNSQLSMYVLFDKDLFSADEKNFNNQEKLTPVSLPDSVGVATTQHDGHIIYFAYQNDERGNLEIRKEFDSFSEALDCAREMYKGLCSYYNGIYTDSAKINSHTVEIVRKGEQQTLSSNSAKKGIYPVAYKSSNNSENEKNAASIYFSGGKIPISNI